MNFWFNMKVMLLKMNMAKAPPTFIAMLVLCLWISIANADYQDPKEPVNRRVEDLLRRMTLEEKIGQMTQIDRTVASEEVMKKYSIGSVLSGGISTPSPTASPKMWMDMISGFQNGSLSSRLKIPMFYGIDAPHGHSLAYKSTVFPHNVALGATRDPQLVKRIGAATALEVRATGIHYVFAPTVAVCRDPRWGRCLESYSEDPNVVREMTEIISGLQGEIPANPSNGVPFIDGQKKVLACAKHYAGDGGTTKGINENNTVASWDELLGIHMPPYYNSITKGVGSIMISYSSWNGVKMHANRTLITNFLKNTLNFKGFVSSDWQGIDKITSPPHLNYTYSILTGINAGIDMIMVPYNYTEFIDGLTSLVKNNFIRMSRIDDAVTRILRVKFTMGLFEHPLPDYNMSNYLGSKEHRELAREAVRKSIVLLKNGDSADKPLLPLAKKAPKIFVAGTHADNIGNQCGDWTIKWQGFSSANITESKSVDKPLLPLAKKAPKILVAGTHADNIGNQCGGWTIEWQGSSSANITEGTTILSAIKHTVDSKTEVVFRENPDSRYVKSNNFSYAIVVVGELPYAETRGDSLNLTIPEPGPSIITNVCASVKCVVVLITGRPVVFQPYIPQIDALVAAWLPGTEGQGVADVLFGDFGFTGKLSFTWFKTVDQLPMHVGDPHYDPLFPFGFGLTTPAPR